MSTLRLATVSIYLVALGACGGGSGSPTGPSSNSSGPQSATVSGSASTDGRGGCSPGSHTISAGEGTLRISIVQASAARVKVQVCHPTATNHATECTVPPFSSVAIGDSVSATLKGGRAQVVSIFPDACGAPGNPPAESITYTVTLNYPG